HGRVICTLALHDALPILNEKMLQSVKQVGGNIERIYYCTDIDDLAFYRKPNPGMAFQAIRDFPDIQPEKCIIVGNSLSDMKFGRDRKSTRLNSSHVKISY